MKETPCRDGSGWKVLESKEMAMSNQTTSIRQGLDIQHVGGVAVAAWAALSAERSIVLRVQEWRSVKALTTDDSSGEVRGIFRMELERTKKRSIGVPAIDFRIVRKLLLDHAEHYNYMELQNKEEPLFASIYTDGERETSTEGVRYADEE